MIITVVLKGNLDAESRNTVVYRKYFHAQYILNFPSTWGLGIMRGYVYFTYI